MRKVLTNRIRNDVYYFDITFSILLEKLLQSPFSWDFYMFLLSKFKKLYALWSYLVFILMFIPFWGLFGIGWRQWFAHILVYWCVLAGLSDWYVVDDWFSIVWTWTGSHNLEFFLETRFMNFLLFELILKRSDIVKWSKTSTFYILFTGSFKIKIAVFPEIFFSLNLL